MCPHQASRIVQIFKIQEVERQWEEKRKVEETAWTVMPRSCKNRRSIGGHAPWTDRHIFVYHAADWTNPAPNQEIRTGTGSNSALTDLNIIKKSIATLTRQNNCVSYIFVSWNLGILKIQIHDLFHLYKVLFTFGSYNSGQIA